LKTIGLLDGTKRVGLVIAVVLGACLAYVLAHLALIEVGREVVVLHKWVAEGESRRTRLWIVDAGEVAYLHHGYPDSAWIQRLADDPFVTVERSGATRRYRATPAPEADTRVHELMRAKYGVADRWVRFVSGGVESCPAMPVRLEAAEVGP
jgi:hypothetical protein